jgi:phenylalanyl-tRNA synthetase beta chain
LYSPCVGSEIFDKFGLTQADPRRQAVCLANPLDSNAPLLRTEILQTLVDVVRRNLSRGFADFGLFEIGQVAQPWLTALTQSPLLGVDRRPTEAEMAQLWQSVPAQPRHVAGVLLGQRPVDTVHGPGRPVDWADAVEIVHRIGRVAHLTLTVSAGDQAPFHPGRCAQFSLPATPDNRAVSANQVIGLAGELHPQMLKTCGLPAGSVGFEIDLDALLAAAPKALQHIPLSTQPIAKEDLAFVVRQSVPADAVVQAVKQGVGALAESIEVFDVYTGDQIAPGHKSIALALRLRAADHTLTTEEVSAARTAAITAVQQQVGGSLRG